ncbi:MAG: hypothetical protein ACOCUI_02325 [bacterium]
MEASRVSLPIEYKTNGMLKEIAAIKYNTRWENYSNRLRSLIGSYILKKINEKNVQVVITSPKNSKIEKYKVFDLAIEFMMGKYVDYMNLQK